MKTRTYDDLSRAMIDLIPSAEEAKALSDEDIEKLRRCGNMIDNVLYLEMIKRREREPDPSDLYKRARDDAAYAKKYFVPLDDE